VRRLDEGELKQSSMTILIASLSAGRKAEVLLLGILVFALGGLTGILSAQSTPGQSEQFEVAAIRPTGANGGRPAMEFTPAAVFARQMSL
jgi:hypothetical protein